MDLNTILIILGILALIGLVAHGIWSNRREKSHYFNNSKFDRNHANNLQEQEVTPSRQNVPNFVQPRTMPAQQIEQSVQNQETVTPPQPVQPQTEYTPPVSMATMTTVNSVEQIKITLPEMVPTEKISEPVFYEYKAEPKPVAENVLERTLAQVEEFAETEEGIDMSSEQIRVQLQDAVVANSSPISTPKLQQSLEELESQHSFEFGAEEKAENYTADNAEKPSKFLLLYVVAAENRRFQGALLAQTLDNLGFIFGKNAQYHRHVDSVASPIIFSVANIEQAGAFNPYAMHDFSTIGVALFMPVPSAVGNDKANLKMMIQAAKNLANELSGFVLTDQESLFNEVAEQHYLAQV